MGARTLTVMASIEERGRSVRVVWRLGGKRTGAPQSLSFAQPRPGSRGHLTAANKAKTLVESCRHAITREEVERLLYQDAERQAPSGTPTLSQWAADWFAERARARDIQPDVLEKYRRMFAGRIDPQLGHRQLTRTDITQDVVREWVAWLRTQKTWARKGQPPRELSPTTVRRAHSLLHSILAAAVGTWLPLNPAASPPGAKRNSLNLPKPEPFDAVFLEIWELNAILDGCSPDMRDIALVLVRSGLRLGELLVLRGEDVITAGKKPRIKVVRALKNDGSIGDPKSSASRREVHIAGAALEVLRARAAGHRRPELLFPAPRGGVWSPHNLRSRHWQPAVAVAQRCPQHLPPLPAKPARGPRRRWRPDEVSTCSCPGRLMPTPRLHDLRHTHVSALIEAGWQPKQIQVRVGHASIDITMDIYGHLWDHGHAERLDRLERVFTMADDEAA